jgi:uncharacterized membrane protein (DUF441 family)
MEKQFAPLVMVLVLCLILCGCASVDVATVLNDQKLTANDDTPVAHLHGTNWGIYILPFIPIISGNTSDPKSISLFSNEVSVESVVTMVTAKSRDLGATKTVDLQSTTTSLWLGPVPLPVFWYKSVEVTGNAIK